MMLKNWEDLPDNMKNDSVRKYYDILYKKRCSLLAKRIFDLMVSTFLFAVLIPLFIIISIAIKVDSKGTIIFRQTRVTQYGRHFKICKFRTMVNNAELLGAQVTRSGDTRITKLGKLLRKYRIDEIPQLLVIISGDMSFVGTRPEVVKYVEQYTDEMMATLLLPAGVTSEASIQYRNEEQLLVNVDNVDEAYTNVILPEKMKINLRSIEEFGFFGEIKTILRTVLVVINRD